MILDRVLIIVFYVDSGCHIFDAETRDEAIEAAKHESLRTDVKYVLLARPIEVAYITGMIAVPERIEDANKQD